MKSNRPSWSSKYSFILAATGSAVGLGNIWRFPYVAGQNGGAVFIFTYIVFILSVCFIPLVTEILTGKITKKECIGAYAQVSPKLKIPGMLNPFTALIVPSFYFVAGGWIIHYLFKSFSGFNDISPELYLNSFLQSSPEVSLCTLTFLFICTFFTAGGVKNGIEFINNSMMPLLAILLISLALYSLNLPGAKEGLEYIFKPDFSKFNASVVLAALGQAFFTLSIGMGCLLTYGSYLKNDDNIVKTAYSIIFASMTFSILAGIVIFPAVFTYNLAPDAGPGLVFVTLPSVFAQLPFGNLFAFLFFLLLFCAAVTSGISMLEVPCAAVGEQLNISRKKACLIVFFIISVLATLSSFSFGILSEFKIFGKTIFELFDFTASNILLPLNTFILCIIADRGFKINGNMVFKNKILVCLFNIGLKYVVPVGLVILSFYFVINNI